jgi:hypothetical protein
VLINPFGQTDRDALLGEIFFYVANSKLAEMEDARGEDCVCFAIGLKLRPYVRGGLRRRWATTGTPTCSLMRRVMTRSSLPLSHRSINGIEHNLPAPKAHARCAHSTASRPVVCALHD